jgi:2-polyprenyl-3-methyl-5-hydroxy-6-metoxy-1,4-benzoquinol methylase
MGTLGQSYRRMTSAVWQRASRLPSKVGYRLYYRYLFGSRMPGVQHAATAIRNWERQEGKGDVPMVKQLWESQYRHGFWNYLSDADEVPRYSVLAGYLTYFRPGGSVLDVGCGAGILQERLGSQHYSKYVGLDVSEAAITQASARADDRTCFIRAEAEGYIPREAFDAIVFNESLYYFESPLDVFERYWRSLQPAGIVVTSLFLTRRSAAIRRELKSLYPVVQEITLTNKDKTWACTVFSGAQGS